MDEKQVQEIFSDEEFVVSLLKMETPEEVQTAVKTKGLELSISDIEKVKAQLVSGKSDELCADDLRSVSGGLSRGTEDKIIEVLMGVAHVMEFATSFYGHLPTTRW